jgi:hypothetical protein
MVMVGFPGETASDARCTADFLSDNARHIVSAKANMFTLSRHSPVLESALVTDLELLDDPADPDAVNMRLRYRPRRGMTLGESQEAAAVLNKWIWRHLRRYDDIMWHRLFGAGDSASDLVSPDVRGHVQCNAFRGQEA